MKRFIAVILIVFLGLSGGVFALYRHEHPNLPQNPPEPAQNAPETLSADKIVTLVNAERKKSGLADLQVTDELSKSSSQKCQDMVDGQYFADINPKTGQPGVTFAEQSYSPSNYYIAENMTQISSTSNQEAVTRWMNSPPHKAIILDGKFALTGLSICQPPNAYTMVVEDFAGPIPPPVVTPTYAPVQNSGTLCNDGWVSPSTGSGTCSHHLGEAN